jgi:hypothetical protein
VFCSHCGQQIPDKSTFCNHCGKAVAPLKPVAANAGPADPNVGAQKLRQVSRTFLILGILNILGGLVATATGWLCGGLSVLLGIWEIINAIFYWSTPPKVASNPTYIAVLEIGNILCGQIWSFIGGILNLNRLKSPEVKAYLATLQGGQVPPVHAPAQQGMPAVKQARRRRWAPIAVVGGGLIFLAGLLLGVFLVVGQNSATPIYEDVQYYYVALLICPAPLLLVGLALVGAGIYMLKSSHALPVADLQPVAAAPQPLAVMTEKAQAAPEPVAATPEKVQPVPQPVVAVPEKVEPLLEPVAVAPEPEPVAPVEAPAQPIVKAEMEPPTALPAEPEPVESSAEVAPAPVEITKEIVQEWEQKRNVPSLVTALAHPDSTIREEAAWALSQVARRNDTQAVEPLLDFLGKASSFSPITSAMEALGKIGDPRAIDRLKAYSSVSDPDMRYWAIWALAEIGGPQTTEILTKALEDETPEIREVAEKALEKAEAAPKPAAPPRPRTTLYAFLAQAPGGVMGFQQSIVLLASDEDMKRTIRDRSGYSDAEVVIVPPEEWNPPVLNSVSQQELSAKFPVIFDAVQRGLARRGVPWVHPQALINDGFVLPNPASGRVYFVYRIDG